MPHPNTMINAAISSPLQGRAAIRQLGTLWLLLAVLGTLAGCASHPLASSHSGPWNLPALSQPPVAQWGATNGLVQELFYQSEPLNGKTTRVFAYLGRPAGQVAKQRPAMVLVHGGGGKAFKD